jgi:hypothetical protein
MTTSGVPTGSSGLTKEGSGGIFMKSQLPSSKHFNDYNHEKARDFLVHLELFALCADVNSVLPLKNQLLLGAVAQACNPSYSGGRDQEDCSSKSAWENSF